MDWVVVDCLVGRGLDADTASVANVCRCSYYLDGDVVMVVCSSSSYVYLDPCVDAGGVVRRALDDCIVLMDNVCCCSDIA